MALSLKESTTNSGVEVDTSNLFKPINLKDLPHLSHYVSDSHLQAQRRPNPLDENPYFHTVEGFYVSRSDVVLRQIAYDLSGTFATPSSLFAYHRAGPRKHVFFQPSEVRAAIVTCGGLCPGLNTVIRELVVGLWDLYGVREIFGVTAGYRGFYSREPLQLNPKLVHDWHRRGGTVLETSRGGFDLHKIVDAIQNRRFNQVRELTN